MEAFHISHEENGDIQVLKVSGYFNADAGKEFQRVINELLSRKKVGIVVEMSQCPSVNSPGAAVLLETAYRIVEDYRGKMIFAGLNGLKISFFEMAGILPLAGIADSLAEALKQFP
jgi:anti-anti-sigma factor